MNEAQEKALALMAVIVDRDLKYQTANRTLRELDTDFPTHITFIDGDVWVALMKLINAVLGDSTGSYFLEEARSMRGGGKVIEVDGTEWPITNVDDVRAYVLHLNNL